MSQADSNTVLSGHMLAGPFVRVFTTLKDVAPYATAFLKEFNGTVEYEFSMTAAGGNQGRVVGLTSPILNVSVVAADTYDAFPDMLKNTRVFYVVDDINAVLDRARSHDLPVLQERTVISVGAQGRFEMPGGSVVELAEFNPDFTMHPDPKELGFA